jgi:hypothetical protein
MASGNMSNNRQAIIWWHLFLPRQYLRNLSGKSLSVHEPSLKGGDIRYDIKRFDHLRTYIMQCQKKGEINVEEIVDYIANGCAGRRSGSLRLLSIHINVDIDVGPCLDFPTRQGI